MIIALPEKDHGHLADALVRDLAFTRVHVDQPLRDLLLALDPFVDSGVTLANMGPSPRLSSKLEQVGGNSVEERWDRLLHPPRPGASQDRCAAEVARLLDVLRERGGVDSPYIGLAGDIVIVGVDTAEQYKAVVDNAKVVAIDGRGVIIGVDRWIAPAGVVGEQEAIIAYVQSLREPKRYGDWLDDVDPAEAREVVDQFIADRVESVKVVGDNYVVTPRGVENPSTNPEN